MVAGIEARGFILAAAVALRTGRGVVPVRKAGKLPAATYAASYELEYGEATLEVHQDAFTAGQRVLVVDDVLATGGTAEALPPSWSTAAGAKVVGSRCCWSSASCRAGSGCAGAALLRHRSCVTV